MQVLLCLQSNALKFTEGGEVHILVEIINEKDMIYLQISVKDTGVGISKDN
jgi:signal transduction histidine kinase